MSPIGTTEIKRKLIGKIHLLREIPGFSAYELAVKHGFEGTEEEWLASLKGEKGDIGTMESHSDIDAQGNRVVNVADPEEDGDAINKGYYADELEALKAFISTQYISSDKYVDIYRKDNKPTASEIGAAPAGYGLGATAGKNITDCNTALLTGWYVCNDGCANTPDTTNFRYASLSVIRRNTAVYQTITYNGLIAHRMGTNSGADWTEWDYENPPLKLGVPYRTTKRYQGKAVYAILQDIGYLPAKSEKTVYLNSGDGIKPTNYLFFQSIITGSSRKHIGNTLVSNDGVPICRVCIEGTKTIEITTFSDVSSYNAKIYAEYTLD